MPSLSHRLSVALVFAAVLPLGAAATYSKSAEIPIGGAGGFDYLTADGANHRLYVSHGTEVVVIDTAQNAVAGRISGLVGVHGIAVAADLGKGFITEGRGGNRVAVFDLKTLAVTAKIDIAGTPEANPDAILYEPTRHQVWSFNHSGKTVTVIDAKTNAIVAPAIPLSGTAETGQADASLHKVFVNIEDTDSVDVIDMNTFKVTGNIKVDPASSPTGMAADPAHHHIFVGGGKALVMIDSGTEKVVASAPICSGTDATMFDAAAGTAFVSCSDGHIASIDVKGDTLTPAQTIDTSRGSRTMALDPVTHKLYVAAVTYLPPAAGAAANARPQAAPDSFHAIVFSPGK